MNAETSVIARLYADLLRPLSASEPSGPDLEYDHAFVMLLAAISPRTEVQYGSFIEAPPSVNWAEIESNCRELLLRTKDIRILVILLRSWIRLRGAVGLRDGLGLLKEMLERYGEALHPLMIFNGERDPAMFANAIAALSDPDGALADVRALPMPRAAGVTIHLRDVEQSFAIPRHKDSLAPESVDRIVGELLGQRDVEAGALVDAARLANSIAIWCNEVLGDNAPALHAFLKVLQPFVPLHQRDGDLSAAVAPELVSSTESAAMSVAKLAGADSVSQSDGPDAGGPLSTDRWQALSAIRGARMWFEQSEPSSPVIVLLRQAERMVGKRFSELVQIIPIDLLSKWDEADS